MRAVNSSPSDAFARIPEGVGVLTRTEQTALCMRLVREKMAGGEDNAAEIARELLASDLIPHSIKAAESGARWVRTLMQKIKAAGDVAFPTPAYEEAHARYRDRCRALFSAAQRKGDPMAALACAKAQAKAEGVDVDSILLRRDPTDAEIDWPKLAGLLNWGHDVVGFLRILQSAMHPLGPGAPEADAREAEPN